MADLSIETSERSILTAAVRSVKRQDVTELVVERLRNLMEGGVLKPGSKLPPEVEMARLFGISRPSLRQAYKALTILGIIRAVPGDGTYIADSTCKTLSMPLTFLMLMKKISFGEIFEFRVMLEGELATLAATRASEDEVRAMHIQLGLMRAAMVEKTRERYLEAEYEFHNCIARGGHNALLLEVISILGGVLWETRKRLVELVSDLSEDFAAHQTIYSSIAARHPQRAGDAMRCHLQVALELFKRAGGDTSASGL